MVERDLAAGGAVTFWTLAEATDRPRLERAFAALGLSSFVPDPRPAPACLRDALEDVLGGPRVLVRPLATRDGFAVINEDRLREVLRLAQGSSEAMAEMIDELLGTDWDAELEPFRYAGDGAPVRWLHKVG